MSSYKALANYYDLLTRDIPYSSFADYYENEFSNSSCKISLVLDLCCGTGSLSYEMVKRGYELISVDRSADMLSVAQAKCAVLKQPPLFICQNASELDLYGTVDAAICSLDSINYISPQDINKVFSRLSLFIKPGGIFIFDIRSEDFLKSLDGTTSIDEDDGIFCVWRSDYDTDKNNIKYGIDLFIQNSRGWQRYQEEHFEYAYSFDYLKDILSANKFTDIRENFCVIENQPGRIFVVARRE